MPDRCLHCHLVDAINEFIASEGGQTTMSDVMVGMARALATAMRNAPPASRLQALAAFNRMVVETLTAFEAEAPAPPPADKPQRFH